MDPRTDNSDYDDSDETEALDSEDEDFDVQHLLDDLEQAVEQKSPAATKAARQRLEDYLEEKRTRQAMYDVFDDYDLDD